MTITHHQFNQQYVMQTYPLLIIAKPLKGCLLSWHFAQQLTLRISSSKLCGQILTSQLLVKHNCCV